MKEKIIDNLKAVYDPEMSINVYDLGLIYEININETHVDIVMTLTSAFCPAADQIIADVHNAVTKVLEVKTCDVKVTFDPPFGPDKMSEETIISLDPWTSKNHLLEENHVYEIMEKAGFSNIRDTMKINNLSLYQTAFVHSSYVKKCIYDTLNKDGTKTIDVSEKPPDAIDLFEEHQDYENQEFLGDRALDFSIAFYIYRKYFYWSSP